MRIARILCRMHKLAVWDNSGREYLPEFDNRGQVARYAPAEQAMNTLLNTYNEWVYDQIANGN